MPTLRERLNAATVALEPVSESARSDAEFMMSAALGVTRSVLFSQLAQHYETNAFEGMLTRRLAHEPVAYILGEWEFFSLPIKVRAPMLVPRPETEHLVEVALETVEGRAARIIEIGTGTGCVALAIAANAPDCQVVATDVNPNAVALAKENAGLLGLADRIEFIEGDLFAPLGVPEQSFDAVCSNPPYVESDAYEELSPTIRLYEDRGALVAGADGLDVIRRLIVEAKPWLKPGGLLAFEMGMGQYDRVRELLLDVGYEDPQVRLDLAGIQRIAYARKPKA